MRLAATRLAVQQKCARGPIGPAIDPAYGRGVALRDEEVRAAERCVAGETQGQLNHCSGSQNRSTGHEPPRTADDAMTITIEVEARQHPRRGCRRQGAEPNARLKETAPNCRGSEPTAPGTISPKRLSSGQLRYPEQHRTNRVRR